MIYVGADNGLSGALVALSSEPGLAPLKMTVMPTRGKSKGNEVDGMAVLKWLMSLDVAWDDMTVVLETPGKFSAGTQSLCSMWDSYGCIRGILECRGIRHHRITPQAWQKVMLPGCAKGDTKPAALAKAKQLWPSETWRASPRCSTPHGGYVDAALIAEWGRIGNL
jgi:hypothetical protein